jgi:SAM-dependent methyltransferase
MHSSAASKYRGEGRGAITSDGCAVELYRRLSYRGELDRIGRWLSPGCSVLELGCGAGRITRALLARGCSVTAVDNSTDMLAHVPHQAAKVCSDIELLHLDGKFDVVLYASNLINIPDDSARHEQLAACRRHLRRDGCLLFERFDPHWLLTVEAGPLAAIEEGVDLTVDRVHRAGRIVEISLRYTADADEWRQHFAAQVLHDRDVERALDEAGFRTVRWINNRWGEAV